MRPSTSTYKTSISARQRLSAPKIGSSDRTCKLLTKNNVIGKISCYGSYRKVWGHDIVGAGCRPIFIFSIKKALASVDRISRNWNRSVLRAGKLAKHRDAQKSICFWLHPQSVAQELPKKTSRHLRLNLERRLRYYYSKAAIPISTQSYHALAGGWLIRYC